MIVFIANLVVPTTRLVLCCFKFYSDVIFAAFVGKTEKFVI